MPKFHLESYDLTWRLRADIISSAEGPKEILVTNGRYDLPPNFWFHNLILILSEHYKHAREMHKADENTISMMKACATQSCCSPSPMLKSSPGSSCCSGHAPTLSF